MTTFYDLVLKKVEEREEQFDPITDAATIFADIQARAATVYVSIRCQMPEPDPDDLAIALAEIVADCIRGVHHLDLIPLTDSSPEDEVSGIMEEHWDGGPGR